MTRAVALWSYRHPLVVLVGWLVFVLGAWQIGGASGTVKLAGSQLLVGQSAEAQSMLDGAGYPATASEHILIQPLHGSAIGRPVHRAVDELLSVLRASPVAINVHSPFSPRGAALISTHRPAVMVDFQIAGDAVSAANRVRLLLAEVSGVQRANPVDRIGEFGDASTQYELNRTLHGDFIRAQQLSIPVTLVVLLLAFGAVVAAGIPVLLAFSAATAALGLVALVSHRIPMFGGVSAIVLLIGMAVGVDYTLFYLAREREERRRALSVEAAVEIAAGTSGRAVLISGGTVICALATLLIAGNRIFTSVAVAVICVVAVAMCGSLTVLPAALGLLGDRVERGRLPGRNGQLIGGSRVWPRVLDTVLGHPVIAVLLSSAVLAALALPVRSMSLQMPGLGDLPGNVPVIATYHRIQSAFPGQLEPAEIVVKTADGTKANLDAAIGALRSRARHNSLLLRPITTTSSTRHVTKISVPLAGDGTDATSTRALALLRGALIPQTIGKVPSTTVAVTGVTADRTDFSTQMLAETPLIVATVLASAFVILLVTFRSLIVPIKAIVLNLLSLAAAYGVLVLVFQHGIGAGLLGTHGGQAIVSWVPLFLFVTLFGLSMDYHIFILTRVRELVTRGTPNDQAVAQGIKTTAGVVTSAAGVMIAVFAIFASLQTTNMKQTGVGLAAAVLIDATLVRAILLPATMTLLGDWNWYLPDALEWLPSKPSRPRA
jgi:RND superfamily putative drug exporter